MNASNITVNAPDERFSSLEHLACDLENLCHRDDDDDVTQLRRRVAYIKAWQARFERELQGLEHALGTGTVS